MIRHWRDLLSEDVPYEAEDFEVAAYRLVTEQALYEAVARQRTAYRIVKEHEKRFREMCALLGMELYVSVDVGYCAARPARAATVKLRIEPTLMALVLRKVYHQARQDGEDRNGHVLISLSELAPVYEESTSREFPSKQRQTLIDLFDTMRRFGIARRILGEQDDGQPFAVEILPAIEFLLDEKAIADLQHHAGHAELSDTEQTDEPSAEDDDEDRYEDA
ncbi:DUF4194 domain-containing protein [Salinisphaera sp. SWV1]|uniref:DUF4194 domain-containing protein n=1 Tax=Salinisphaera sp. SWV1 TaxID=3454139 RepID=UPI003F830532